MKRQIVFGLFLLVATALPAQCAQKLKIVATIPDLVDMVQRVGGDLVSADGLARGGEDIHRVTMRPSFVTKLNRADAVVVLGLTVEHSFLPGLLEVAVNPRIKPAHEGCSGPGCIDCSEGVFVLDKPESLSRSEGEIHPLGNPHYNLSPDNGPQMARNIERGLSRIDPGNAAQYAKNLKVYLAELEPKIAEWKKLVIPLKGVKAVSYHKDVAYLGRFTGIDFIDSVEFKPGVGPTPAHLTGLVKRMKEQNVRLIVREQHFEAKTNEWLARETGAKIAVIGVMANSMPGTETYIMFMESNLRALVAAAARE